MVLLQNWPFFHLFILGSIGQQNVFYDIVERKNAFLGYKNKNFKQSKNYDFWKGFGAELAIFPFFYFKQYRQQKCTLPYSKRKKRLSRLQKRDEKKSRKFKIFAKWLGHCFGPKLAIFPSFYFRQYRQEKCVLRCFRTKKTPSRL